MEQLLVWLILVLGIVGGGRDGMMLELDPCIKHSCEAVSTQLHSTRPTPPSHKKGQRQVGDLRMNKPQAGETTTVSWTKYLRHEKLRKNLLASNHKKVASGDEEGGSTKLISLHIQQTLKPKKLNGREGRKEDIQTDSRETGHALLIEREDGSQSAETGNQTIDRKEEVLEDLIGYRLQDSGTRERRWIKTQARTVLKLDFATRRKEMRGCHKYAVFKVFGSDFVLCLILGSFLEDSILQSTGDLRVSIYGNGSEYRTRKLSSMHLQIAEGHLIGQELSSVRGYVWRDKFYGTVRTHKYILQIEPLPESGPVITRFSSVSNRMLNAYVYRVYLRTTQPSAKSKTKVDWNSKAQSRSEYQNSKNKSRSDYQNSKDKSRSHYQNSKDKSRSDYHKSKDRSRSDFQYSKDQNRSDKQNSKDRSRSDYQNSKDKSRSDFQNSKDKSRSDFQNFKDKSRSDYQNSKDKSRSHYQNSKNKSRSDNQNSKDRSRSDFQNSINYLENEIYKTKLSFSKSDKSGKFVWSRKRRETKRLPDPGCKSCGLLLIADHTFYNEVGEGSIKQTVLQMLYHVRESNIILSKLKFGGEASQDCLALHVAGIGVITAEHYEENLLRGQFKTPEQFLRAFSRYQLDGYCLAVLFSSRVLGSHVLGLSWQGDPTRSAGVCQTRRNIKINKNKQDHYNLNSLFITLRTKKTQRIPLRMGVLNLAHEILHSFGAQHDNSSCNNNDAKRNGRYLMSKYSGTGLLSNHERISVCTKAALSDSLSNPDQTYCLHPTDRGYCGNGVVESGEECDCGGVVDCLESRSCCTPPGLRRGERECTWRRSWTPCTNKTEVLEEILDEDDLGFNLNTHPTPGSQSERSAKNRKDYGSKDKRDQLCRVLGLASCRCRSGCECCMTKTGNCSLASSFILNFFREVQDSVRNCGLSVLTCLHYSSRIYHSYPEYHSNPYYQEYHSHPSYPEYHSSPSRPYSGSNSSSTDVNLSSISVLRGLSSMAPDKAGTVLCLQSRMDSNCWQISLKCLNQP